MCLTLCTGGVARGQAAAPDPKAILKQMVERYARLTSYQDSGAVQTLDAGSWLAAGPAAPRLARVSSGGDTLVSFKTFYARPRMFRFEWRNHLKPTSREAVVWSDGRKSYGWMPNVARGDGDDGSFVLQGGEKLRSYVEEAQRSSSGAAFFVPSLLMKDLDYIAFGEMLGSMSGLKLIREERFDGEVCHVIGGDIFGGPWLLWVGKESRLLRKTRTLYTSGSFHETLRTGRARTMVAEEVHRDIRVNEKLPAGTFSYRPRLRADDIDLTR